MFPAPESEPSPTEAPPRPLAPFGGAPYPPLSAPEPVHAPDASPQADPLASVTWSRGLDDLLPVGPRPQGRASLSVRDVFRRRRPQVSDPEPSPPFEPAGDADFDVAAPVPGVTPDDRESYAFWSRDPAPLADFSDVAAMPDEPLDRNDER